MLACLPVAAAHLPQMSDYPAHLARYLVMLDAGRDPFLARYYGFAWAWTGNLGVDMLIRPAAALFGLEPGGRIIVVCIAIAMAGGVLAAEWAVRRRITAASLLALAFVWSPMLLVGLLNFALGQAAALWAFAGWVRVRPGWRRAAAFVAIGLAVWLCHMSAWLMLGVLVLGYEWALRPGWRALLAPWPLLAPVAVMALTLGGNGTSTAASYGPYWWLYKEAIWLKAMRDTNFVLDYCSLVGVALALLAAVWFGRIDARLGLAAGVLLAGSWLVPRHVSGGDYADYRLVTAGLMVAALSIRMPAAAWPAWAAGALYGVRLAVTTLGWHADSVATERFLAALDHVPRGARIASAVLIPREPWRLDHFEHIGAYAVLRDSALVNANFAVPHIHMLHVKQGGPGFADPSQRIQLRTGQKVDLARFAPARHMDWLWYVGPREPATLPAGAVVVWRVPGSLLARLR